MMNNKYRQNVNRETNSEHNLSQKFEPIKVQEENRGGITSEPDTST